jgi:hypothetical protein
MRKAAYLLELFGGGGRIRTDASRFCRPLPYHLGTPPRKFARTRGLATLARHHRGVQLCAAASGVLHDEIRTLLNRAVLSKILDEVPLTDAQCAENRLAGTEKTTDLSRATQP